MEKPTTHSSQHGDSNISIQRESRVSSLESVFFALLALNLDLSLKSNLNLCVSITENWELTDF